MKTSIVIGVVNALMTMTVASYVVRHEYDNLQDINRIDAHNDAQDVTVEQLCLDVANIQARLETLEDDRQESASGAKRNSVFAPFYEDDEKKGEEPESTNIAD